MATMWDRELFLWLNGDGGEMVDSLMLFASGKLSWILLYALILFMVWVIYRRWQSSLLAAVMIAAAVGIADLFCGIFKQTGPLKNLWVDFPARLRPMYEPDIAGLVHFIDVGGWYGTISAHAATATAIALISALIIRERWFTAVISLQVLLVCYSRIYLGYHYPQDILIGVGVGVISGYLIYLIFNILNTKLIHARR